MKERQVFATRHLARAHREKRRLTTRPARHMEFVDIGNREKGASPDGIFFKICTRQDGERLPRGLVGYIKMVLLRADAIEVSIERRSATSGAASDQCFDLLECH